MKDLKRIYIDVKVTSWDRHWFEVEEDADPEEIYEMWDRGEIFSEEIENLDADYEILTPQENNGYSTIEIYDEYGTPLWENGVKL